MARHLSLPASWLQRFLVARNSAANYSWVLMALGTRLSPGAQFIPLFSPVGHGEQVLIIANVKPCACIFPANTRQIPALVSTGTSVLGGSHPYWPEAVLLVVAFLWTGPPDPGWTENSLTLSHKMRVPDRTLFCHFNNWKLWFSWPRGHLIWRQERKGVHQHYGSVT